MLVGLAIILPLPGQREPGVSLCLAHQNWPSGPSQFGPGFGVLHDRIDLVPWL